MFYLAIFLISIGLTYIIKVYAIKKSLIAEVNERSSHTVPTPHGGGIAIAIIWFIGITYLYFFDKLNSELYYALMLGLVISVISFFDDIIELSAKLRLLVQALLSILLLFMLGGLQKIDLIIYEINNPYITNIFAFFMVIWFINLYNFLDGIDGYAGSQAIFLGIAGYILFADEYFLVLIASCLGFLVWNWHKAKIFMGDVGSTLLGYNVAVFTIHYQNQDGEYSSILVWFILFGLFWFDATLTLFRRFLNKEKLSQAHKKHAYQRLTQSGWNHSKVVIYSIVVNFILLGLVFTSHNLFFTFLISLLILYIIMSLVDMKKGFI